MGKYNSFTYKQFGDLKTGEIDTFFNGALYIFRKYDRF